MNSSNTNTASFPNAGSVFVPMNESQMDSAKGGDDVWQSQEVIDLILDWVEEQQADPDSIVSQIIDNFIDDTTTFDEGLWEDLGDAMEDAGLTLPSLEDLFGSMLGGGF